MANQKLPTLKYTGKSESAVPIVSESELQTVTAEPWVKISDKGLQLEGLNFNREGQLFLLDVFEGNILKLIPQQKRLQQNFSLLKIIRQRLKYIKKVVYLSVI